MMDWIISHKIGIAIYVGVHLATYYMFVHVLGKAHLKNKKTEFGRLEPFKRVDISRWSILNPMVFLVAPRFVLGVVNLLFYTVWVMIFMIGVKDKISPFRYKMIRFMGFITCRNQALIGGLNWVNIEYVEKCGYEKYLGPDWKPEWSGVGTIICNHVCWMDIVVILAYFFPSFVSKKSVKSYPGVGPIAQAIDCVFLERAGTKEEKIAVGQAIERR
jgi:1-acyl-sn-glycerol-3-phosphate acyltransferase